MNTDDRRVLITDDNEEATKDADPNESRDEMQLRKLSRFLNKPLFGGWVSEGDGYFRAVPMIKPILDPDCYTMMRSSQGKSYFRKQHFPSDKPIYLPGLPIDYIVQQIKKFWGKAALYEKYNLIHKRGILMYGAPGCGKTCIIRLLCDELIKAGGIIFSITNFHDAVSCISDFRRCEPDRPILTVMEDVEGMFRGEGGISQVQAALSFLDGQDQLNNITHIATTNDPEGLADKFIKRPGRFDLVISIHAPSAETREAYLRNICGNQVPEDKLRELVKGTEGLGLAYLRELASTFLCLDIPLDETLGRLRKNFDSKGLKTLEKGKVGFTIGYEKG